MLRNDYACLLDSLLVRAQELRLVSRKTKQKVKLSSVINSLISPQRSGLGSQRLFLYLRFEIMYFLPYLVFSLRRAAKGAASADRQHD